MHPFTRVVLVVLDSLGIGALPDAGRYGDEGSDTLGNVSRKLGRLDLPVVVDLEIGHVPPHLPLVNGALARVVVDGDTREITQHLR